MTKAECLANVRCALQLLRDAKAGRIEGWEEAGRALRAAQSHYNNGRPYVSLDHLNANIGEEELIKHLGGWSSDRVPLPKYSPDVHQVVEHFIGRLKEQFGSWCPKSLATKRRPALCSRPCTWRSTTCPPSPSRTISGAYLTRGR
jgi:hypothetical protein